MVHIIDYGVGNIQAFLNVYKKLGIQCIRAKNATQLESATHLILPGVGSFDHAMLKFKNSGMCDKVKDLVFNEKVPLLGICVGMQMLASSSEEGKEPGLNWIPGTVRSFRTSSYSKNLPMPHMGWNDVSCVKESKLFTDFTEEPLFYFLHSFYFKCDFHENSLAKAEYGFTFDCIVSSGNIYGVQCHPEKSHKHGTLLLKNFAEL